MLGAVGERDDLGRLTLAALAQLDTHARLVAVLPSRLDQQPTQMRVPSFRDDALATLVAATVLARRHPQLPRYVRRRREAPHVEESRCHSEPGHRRDTTEASQRTHLPPTRGCPTDHSA
jgi:hypothetical protein